MKEKGDDRGMADDGRRKTREERKTDEGERGMIKKWQMMGG